MFHGTDIGRIQPKFKVRAYFVSLIGLPVIFALSSNIACNIWTFVSSFCKQLWGVRVFLNGWKVSLHTGIKKRRLIGHFGLVLVAAIIHGNFVPTIEKTTRVHFFSVNLFFRFLAFERGILEVASAGKDSKKPFCVRGLISLIRLEKNPLSLIRVKRISLSYV